jgi:hypothetical protein
MKQDPCVRELLENYLVVLNEKSPCLLGRSPQELERLVFEVGVSENDGDQVFLKPQFPTESGCLNATFHIFFY